MPQSSSEFEPSERRRIHGWGSSSFTVTSAREDGFGRLHEFDHQISTRFTHLPDAIEAQTPDKTIGRRGFRFLLDLLDIAPDDMLATLDEQARALKNPPTSLDQLLAGLGAIMRRFEAAVRARLDPR